MCLDTPQSRRKFMKIASYLDMVSEEHVYVMLGMRGFAFGQIPRGVGDLSNGLTPFWEDLDNNHTDDSIVKNAARRMLTIDLNSDDVDPQMLKDFQEQVVERVREDPLYCSTPACMSNNGKPMAIWARHLYDVFYLYGLALNDSLRMDPIGGLSNASSLTEAMKRSFVGLTGLVTINANGSRIPLFSAYVLDANFNQVTAINFTIADGIPVMTRGYKNEAATLWGTRGGQRPLARPKCGYTGSDCPKPFWEQNGIYMMAVSGLIAVLLIVAGVVIVYAIRIRREEEEQQRLLWQIPYVNLRKPPTSQQSKHSLQSGPSVMTGGSRLTESSFGYFDVYLLNNEVVLTRKYSAAGLTEDCKSEFQQMTKLDHDNINRFIGLSIDGTEYVAVWRMCSRGTLQELISKGSLWLDPFFMLCIVRDIGEGLRFLHNSAIGYHGRLCSSCCLVSDGWQVKISDYGTGSLREDNRLTKKRLLWLAPEHLRSSETSAKASKEGDVYSFAIIASEVVTRKEAWNMSERKEQIDELLYMLKKGGPAPPRPDLNVEGEINVAVALALPEWLV